eukprot:scaffold13966_cov110-Skeletonema_dohrnii-CCMP3373.AAC.7
MGTSLPLHPSLAAALTAHGSDVEVSSKPQHQTGTGRKTSIAALSIHPSLPRVAYLAEDTASDFSARNKSKPGSTSLQPTVKNSRLVIQKFDCNVENIDSLAPSQGNVIATLKMTDLPQQINRFRQHKSKTSKISNQPFTLATLGSLKNITFLDRDALFWQTRRKYGIQSNLEASNASDRVLDVNANKCYKEMMGQGLCLGLQFTSVLVILQFDDTQSDPFTVLSCLEGQRALTNNGKDYVTQHVPSSAAVPITNSIIVYGCSDGAMRFHSLVPSMIYSSKSDTLSFSESSSSPPIDESEVKSAKNSRQATIKSVRGPNGRNDPVVKIVNVDPAYNENYNNEQDTVPAHIGGSAATVSNAKALVLSSRLLTIGASGVAFLWQVDISIDRASGTLRDLNVLPPLARLDGLGSLTVSPRKSPSPTSRSTRVGGFWGGITTKEPIVAPYSNITPVVFYDPHRDQVIWTLPYSAPASAIVHQRDFKLSSLAPNSPAAKKEVEDRAFVDKWAMYNGGFVKMWSMSLVDALVKATPGASSHRPPPIIPPYATMKLPLSLMCASKPLSMVPGLACAPLPASSLSCLCLSKDATELIVVSAPLTSVAAASDEQRVPQSPKAAAGKPPKTIFIESQTCHKIQLPRSSDASMTVPALISASHLAPDSVAVATDNGVAMVKLVDGNCWDDAIDSSLMGKGAVAKEPSSSAVPAGPIHTVISGGPVGGVGNNRPGVLFVENHSVLASRLGSSRSSSENRQPTVEKVDLADAMVLYQLEKASYTTTKETRTSKLIVSPLPLTSPPRLIPSPSGRYLCLLWEGKQTYDILHAGSLLVRETGDIRGQGVSPSCDSGDNVLSFAWIGDDDQFAVLRQVEIDYGLDGEVAADSDTTDKKSRPRVELFKLAEVEVGAPELAGGAGVAAATTVSVGSLTVRGGDRVVPQVLFGGPALCIGCSIMSANSMPDTDEGMAYFYTRKSGAIMENDERASNYMTVGTSIPYPDLLAWDDDGLLCAVAYGSRVAIYLSDPPKFTLLGSVNVVGGSRLGEAEQPIISLKFIHGVLYCSGPSSVHVVFLGNLAEEDTVCELDTYTIASSRSVPLQGTDRSDDFTPTPVITSLSHPHILTYHSGGLLVSTDVGLRLLPLSHPLIRIGTLLAANLTEKARKWIFDTPKAHHDFLAHFLIRRGRADLAIRDLNGLSLETYIDLCIRYERTSELENLINTHGGQVVKEISSWGREEGGYSAISAIGLYMLGKDKIDCVTRLVGQLISCGTDEGLVDAIKLASLIGALDQNGGGALLQNVIDVVHQKHPDNQVPLVSIVK